MQAAPARQAAQAPPSRAPVEDDEARAREELRSRGERNQAELAERRARAAEKQVQDPLVKVCQLCACDSLRWRAVSSCFPGMIICHGLLLKV